MSEGFRLLGFLIILEYQCQKKLQKYNFIRDFIRGLQDQGRGKVGSNTNSLITLRTLTQTMRADERVQCLDQD